MLSTLLYCFNAVAPVFVIVALGRLLAARGGVGDDFFRKLNGLVYRWLIPAVLFDGVYRADLYSCFDGRLILFLCASVMALFLLSYLLARRLYRERQVAGSFCQGCFKSNYLLLAIPILGNLLGSERMGKAMMVAPFLVILYNLLGVVTFRLFSGEAKAGGFKRALALVWDVVRNPMVLSVLLALPFALLRVRMPLVLERSVGYIADIGTPVALVCIGGVLSLDKLRRTWRPALLSAFLKVVVSTLLMVALAVLLGFRDEALAIIAVTFAAPTAANSYTTAVELGGDGDTAAANVLLTTLFSLFAIVIFMTVLLRLGYI